MNTEGRERATYTERFSALLLLYLSPLPSRIDLIVPHIFVIHTSKYAFIYFRCHLGLSGKLCFDEMTIFTVVCWLFDHYYYNGSRYLGRLCIWIPCVKTFPLWIESFYKSLWFISYLFICACVCVCCRQWYQRLSVCPIVWCSGHF